MKKYINIVPAAMILSNLLILLWSTNSLVSYAQQNKIGCVAYSIIFSSCLLSLNFFFWNKKKSEDHE